MDITKISVWDCDFIHFPGHKLQKLEKCQIFKRCAFFFLRLFYHVIMPQQRELLKKKQQQ